MPAARSRSTLISFDVAHNRAVPRGHAEAPIPVRRQARSAYLTFMRDHRHPGLRFRRVHERLPIYSVRIGLHYRALGRADGDEIIWFWVGTHAEYDALVAGL